MADLNIENIVVSARIASSLNLEVLADTIPNSKYNPGELPVLLLHFSQPKVAAMVFSSGRVVITGAKTIEEVETSLKILSKQLQQAGIITSKKPIYDIKNIVASTQFNKTLNLPKIASHLDNVQYEPEHFPGIIHRTTTPSIVIMLFNSGKIVGNGTNLEEISIAIDKLSIELSSQNMI